MENTAIASVKLRDFFSEMNILTRSDGSVLSTQGSTSSCLISVNGPMEMSTANVDINRAYIDVLYRSKSGIPGVHERYKEKIIRKICETIILTACYPKNQIVIQIQELDDNDGMFACVINACNIAIINSGLEMKCNVAAVHCILNEEGNIEVDPEFLANDVPVFTRISKARRSRKYKANFTFVFDSLNENLISVMTNGSFTLKNYHEALQLSKQAASHIFNFYLDITKKYANVI